MFTKSEILFYSYHQLSCKLSATKRQRLFSGLYNFLDLLYNSPCRKKLRELPLSFHFPDIRKQSKKIVSSFFMTNLIRNRMNNQHLKQVVLAMILLLSFSLRPLFSQDLGANFNENIDKVTPTIVAKTNVKWVRGFVNIPALCLNITSAGVVTGVNQTAIQNLTRLDNMATAKTVNAGDQPVRMIFSLKLDFLNTNMGVPAVGTPTMTYLMSAIEKVLTRKNFGANIDILAVGNEPMWETPTADADKYEAFLNLLIDKVDSMRTANNWNYEIYAGALNKANSNTTHTILQKVLKIAKQNPKIVGLDMHEHVTTLTEAENDIKYIRTSQQFTKELMCTEFSLVWLWGAHASDALGSWGTANGYSSTSKMYEWLNQLIQKSNSGTPVSSDHFLSYFNSTSWYPKNWFYNFYKIFKKYNFSQITYGIQNLPVSTVLTSSTVMWTLNFACNGTYLGLDSDKLGNRNPLVYPAFKTITDSLLAKTSGLDKTEAIHSPFQISPNPAKSFLRIQANENFENTEVIIYTLNGQKVYSNPSTQLPLTINLVENNIPAGIYLLAINCKGEKSYSHKIMIE
jgi:hypothetical protein